jgi:hypothetical protein
LPFREVAVPQRNPWARGSAIIVGILSAWSTMAWAQGAARDQGAALSATTTEANKSWLQKRFAGSYAELSTYIGSGTFYTTGYHDPYVSNALYLRPSYQLGTKYDLSLNARVYLEAEYTQPDNPNGRRFYPLDTWFFLAAKNLYTNPASKIKISGTFRTVLPTSYESRWAHMLFGAGAGVAASRGFEFGRPDAQGKRWELAVALGSVFTKYVRTSALRGDGPGESNGCRAPAVIPAGGALGPGGLPASAETDRCGGPLSTSFSTMTSGNVSLGHGRYSLSTTLILINEFRYSVPNDVFTDPNAVPMGRADWTWGIIAAGYQLTDRFALSAGIASYQPALNSSYTAMRFPFFDFAGPNANNFTQVFVGVNGTL